MRLVPWKSGSYIEAGTTLMNSRCGGGRSRAVRSARRRQWRSSSKTRSVAAAASKRLIGLCCCVPAGPRERASKPRMPPVCRSTMGWKTVVIWWPSSTSWSRQRVWKSACIFWMRTLSQASPTRRATTRSAMISGLWKTTA